MKTQDLINRRIEAKKAVQDSIDKISKGKTIETYVIAGFSLIVLVIVFISFF